MPTMPTMLLTQYAGQGLHCISQTAQYDDDDNNNNNNNNDDNNNDNDDNNDKGRWGVPRDRNREMQLAGWLAGMAGTFETGMVLADQPWRLGSSGSWCQSQPVRGRKTGWLLLLLRCLHCCQPVTEHGLHG
jgi:hypothetical protein